MSPWSPPSHKGKPSRKASDRAYYVQKRANGKDPLVKLRGRRWRKVRAIFLRQHPLCQVCQAEGVATQTQEVHHVIPAREDPTRFYDMSNLQALCKRHHAIESAKERRRA